MPSRRICGGTQIYILVYHNLPLFSRADNKIHKNVPFCRRKGLAKDSGRCRIRRLFSGKIRSDTGCRTEFSFCGRQREAPEPSTKQPKTADTAFFLPAAFRRPCRPQRLPKAEIFMAHTFFLPKTGYSQPAFPCRRRESAPAADFSESRRNPKLSRPALRARHFYPHEKPGCRNDKNPPAPAEAAFAAYGDFFRERYGRTRAAADNL